MSFEEPDSLTAQQVYYEFQRMDQLSTQQERKHVVQIRCGDCDTVLSNRGMRAVLLSDRSVNLVSTDLSPLTVGFTSGIQCASACLCCVRETACLQCGQAVGYYVDAPCRTCLGQSNNGHHWMFRTSCTVSSGIYVKLGLPLGNIPLLWGFIDDGYHTNDTEDDRLLSVNIPSKFPLQIRRKGPCIIDAHTPDQASVDTYTQNCR